MSTIDLAFSSLYSSSIRLRSIGNLCLFYTENHSNILFLSNFDFVYQHVKNLRKKISAADGMDYIETVYGLGYKFNVAKTKA